MNEYPALSSILPYKAITKDVILSASPDQITAVLEIHISENDSEEIMEHDHSQLMTVLCDTVPENTYVSIYFCKTFAKMQLPYKGAHRNTIVNYLEQKRIESLNNRNHPVYNCYMTITIPVSEVENKDFKLLEKLTQGKSGKTTEIDSINIEAYTDAMSRMDMVIKRLQSNLHGSLIRLTSDRILYFLSLILNHQFQQNYTDLSGVLTSDFTFSENGLFNSKDPGYVHYARNYHNILSLRAYDKQSKLPDFCHAGMNQGLYNERIADIPFTVQQTLFFPAKQEGLRAARMKSGMIAFKQGTGAILGKWAAKTPEGLPPEVLKQLVDEAIQIVETSNERFLRMTWQVHLWENTLENLTKNVKNFLSVISSSGYTLKKEKYNIRAAYMSLFPGMEHINPISIMMSSYTISDFMPIDLPRTCFKHKKSTDFVFFENAVGCLTELDLFDNRASNWNSLVCGGSGSGKSFFVNALIDQYSIYNPQIAIVDYGGEGAGSYRNFVINNHGTYIEIGFDQDQDFSVNPFDGQLFDDNGQIIAMKQKGLLTTINYMVSTPEYPVLPRIIQEELCRLFDIYYKEHDNNKDNTCDLSDFANRHLKENEVIARSGRNLHSEMFFFINNGIYSRFFRKTAAIANKDIICFDLAGLKEHSDLRNVLIPTLLQMITGNILNTSDRKKMLIFDEAWKDLKGGDMTDFMEAASRTLRKLNGQITIISQLLEDILDSPIGKALLANTSYFYFVGGGHNPEGLQRVKATSEAGTRILTDYDKRSIYEQKGKRDVHLLTPFFSGKIRFRPTPEFAMFATTNADEKKILNKYKKLLNVDVVTPEVIEAAKEEFTR